MNAVVKFNESRFAKVPPHSIEAEQSVLGGLMLVPEKIEVLANTLAPADFYRKDHKIIYTAMLELSARGAPCDAITLGDWFETNGLGEMMGGADYCYNLANTTPSASNIPAYAQIVREKSVLRQVIDQAGQLVEMAYANESTGVELVDRGITELMAMQKVETRSEYTLRQAMTLAFAEAERAKALGGKIPGISSGIASLDRILGGWHDSDLIVIGARPAMGKTALMLNFVTACALPTGIVSSEQPAQQIAARVMSMKSLVPAERLRNGRFDTGDMRKLESAVGELCDRVCLIYDRSAPTIADVSRMLRKWQQQNKIRLGLVDYIQRIEAYKTKGGANKTEKVGEVVRGLKNAARDMDIPIIALAQVGRGADNCAPRMSHLSDSSEIEKEADQILMLDRPSEYDDSADPYLAIIDVVKNRHGPTGSIKARWHPETMRFTDYAENDDG